MASSPALAAILASLLFASPALALDTVRCADADGVVKLEFDIAFKDEERSTGVVSRVVARFKDFAISTEPADVEGGGKPDHIADQVSERGRLEVDLGGPEDIWTTLYFRLFRDTDYGRRFDENAPDFTRSVAAGTLAAMNVGVWAITCDGW